MRMARMVNDPFANLFVGIDRPSFDHKRAFIFGVIVGMITFHFGFLTLKVDDFGFTDEVKAQFRKLQDDVN